MARRRRIFKSNKKQKALYYTLIGGAVLGGLWLIRKAAGGSRIDWFTKGVKIKNGKLYYLVDIINPSNSTVTVNNIYLNFYYKTTPIGRIFYNEPLVIPANQTVTASILVKFSYGLIYLIKDLITNLRTPLNIRMSGGIKAEKINIPIDDNIIISPSDYLP
jgi:LEA14-like dessication related protein